MEMKIHEGMLKELGNSVSDASGAVSSSVYSYIEFADGEVIRNLAVFSGLDGKLRICLRDRRPLELHIHHGGKKAVLVALRQGDGKLFAVDLEQSLVANYVLAVLTTAFAVLLVPVFGIGLAGLYLAYLSWKGIAAAKRMRDYVRALPGVIRV